MAGEMTMRERLMRQKNAILQRQLEVNLQILDKEERASQRELEHMVEEYSDFLRQLPFRWTGLETYMQPDTRAIRKNASLKDRKSSVLASDGTVQIQNDPETPSPSAVTTRQSTVAPRPSTLAPGQSTVAPRPSTVSPRQTIMSPQPSTLASRQTTVVPPSSISYRPKTAPAQMKDRPKFQTCLEVLDDILMNHSFRKKPERHRRIGLVMPVTTEETRPPPNSVDNTEGQKEKSGRSFRVRPASSYVSPRTSTDMSAGVQSRVRPHTAQPQRSPVRVSYPRTETIRRPCSAAMRPKRPKSAPPKYGLYGRSPAVPRRTVAGIMAEMHSRRAATRNMVSRSKELHTYIEHLAWAGPSRA